MMKRTISGMIGAGSLAHNRRDFVAENVDSDIISFFIVLSDKFNSLARSPAFKYPFDCKSR